jgi:hypothetical protein
MLQARIGMLQAGRELLPEQPDQFLGLPGGLLRRQVTKTAGSR